MRHLQSTHYEGYTIQVYLDLTRCTARQHVWMAWREIEGGWRIGKDGRETTQPRAIEAAKQAIDERRAAAEVTT